MKTKKRFLRILLSLVMVLGLMPGMSLTAYADGQEAYAAYDVTTEANKNKSGDALTALQVTFHGMKWYIIADNSTAVDAGTVTLLAKECVTSSKYNENRSFVEYSSNPTVKRVVDDWYRDNITADAKKAVSDNAMFLLTTVQANAITNADVRKDATATGYWWLCSQGTGYAGTAAYAGGEYGAVYASGTNVDNTLGVRPALKLDLSSVIFSSESKTFSLKPTYTVTYQVVNGTWSDGSTTDKTETVAEGSKPASVPTGMKASDGYTGGSWDTNPVNTTITGAKTFTYTFTAKQSEAPQSQTEASAPAAQAERITIPKAPAKVKAKTKKNSITVSWNKIKKNKKTKALRAMIKNIEVQYSTNPAFPKEATVTRIIKKNKTKLVLRGLTRRTLYYVRVRYLDGAGGYSRWSRVKRARTK